MNLKKIKTLGLPQVQQLAFIFSIIFFLDYVYKIQLANLFIFDTIIFILLFVSLPSVYFKKESIANSSAILIIVLALFSWSGSAYLTSSGINVLCFQMLVFIICASLTILLINGLDNPINYAGNVLSLGFGVLIWDFANDLLKIFVINDIQAQNNILASAALLFIGIAMLIEMYLQSLERPAIVPRWVSNFSGILATMLSLAVWQWLNFTDVALKNELILANMPHTQFVITNQGWQLFSLYFCFVLGGVIAVSFRFAQTANIRHRRLIAAQSQETEMLRELRQKEKNLTVRKLQLETANKEMAMEIRLRRRVENKLKANDQKLRKYANKLESRNKELRIFADIATHHLQEPLRKIQTFGERLNTRYKSSLEDDALFTLQRMQNSAERVQNLISDWLIFSQYSLATNKFTQLDLSLSAQIVKDRFSAYNNFNDDWFNIDQLPIIEADEAQIRFLFGHLIENSIKFNKPNQPLSISLRKVVIPIRSNWIRLQFRDNGIGFEQEYADKIFLAFQRVHTEDIPGTGIGLAICKRIVELHNGKISALSSINEGTSIYIDLPISQTEHLDILDTDIE